jgi:hypothetical protein
VYKEDEYKLLAPKNECPAKMVRVLFKVQYVYEVKYVYE